MNKRKITVGISIAAILVLSFVLMGALSSLKKDPPKRPPQVVKRYVKAQPVKYTNIETWVSGAGRLASRQQIDLGSEVQGKVLAGKVPLKKGQDFRKGQLLFKIYDKEARLALLAKKSRFLNAIANILPDLKIDFPKSYSDYNVFFDAIDISDDFPPLPVPRSSKEKIFLASRNILSDYYSIKGDESRLRKYEIYAPFTGTYTGVFLEVGSVANPGSKIARIISTEELELEVPIETGNIKWIRPGDKVDVSTEDGSSSWQGIVVRKSTFVDPDTQSIPVFVKLTPNKKYPLYEGLYLKAVFPGIVLEKTMEIPRNAVFNGNEVYTVKNGLLTKSEIKVHKINQETMIFSGLQKGTELVTEPLINARDNSPVEIIR